MIIVSVAFVVCWFPVTFYFFVVDTTNQTSSDMFAGYYATVFLSYVYICMNPFIYATKHEAVKEKFARLMFWRQCVGAASVAGAPGSNINRSNIARGTQQPHIGSS